MSTKDFFKKELQILSSRFPLAGFKYGIDRILLEHVVEIYPSEQYNQNSELDIEWMAMFDRFEKLFPQEELIFTSSESNLRVEIPLLHYKSGRHLQDYHSVFASIISQFRDERVADDWMSLIEAKISADFDHNKVSQCLDIVKMVTTSNLSKYIKLLKHFKSLQATTQVFAHLEGGIKIDERETGHSSYAMAA
jgi:hypothetical protein